jgi:hypothetical protein
VQAEAALVLEVVFEFEFSLQDPLEAFLDFLEELEDWLAIHSRCRILKESLAVHWVGHCSKRQM